MDRQACGGDCYGSCCYIDGMIGTPSHIRMGLIAWGCHLAATIHAYKAFHTDEAQACRHYLK